MLLQPDSVSLPQKNASELKKKMADLKKKLLPAKVCIFFARVSSICLTLICVYFLISQ